MPKSEKDCFTSGTGWIFWIGLFSFASFSFLLSELLSPSDDTPYLVLQSQSDRVHRLMVIVFSCCLPTLLIDFFVLLFVKNHKLRTITKFGLVFLLTTIGSATNYITGFDRLIEHQGIQGQLLLPGNPLFDLSRPKFELGQKPQFVKKTDLLVLVASQNPAFEDDVRLTALSTDSEEVLWSFHCLGNAMNIIFVDEDDIYFFTDRPSFTSIYRLHWSTPELVWTVSIPANLFLPPRVSSSGIQVAHGGKILLLDQKSGKIRSQIEACKFPESTQIECHNGRAVAWKTEDNP